MVWIVLLSFLSAFFPPWLCRVLHSRTGWIVALLPAAITAYFARFIEEISSGGTVVESMGWVPCLGIELSFHLDGLSLLFALLISGIGTLVVIYSGSYLAGHYQLGRFYSTLLIFMASMLGTVLADNVITLFVFWELTSFSSYLLIGFNSDQKPAREAALQALLVTGAGGLALLAGFLLLGQAAGTLEISALLAKGDAVRSHPFYVPIFLLILAGAMTKSAQFPFHFWLPNAMQAPTPVSTYLHSATMVKAGVYLLARLSPVLAGTAIWENVVTPVGMITMLTGAFLSLLQTDLKLVLAYSTVSALGVMTMMLGVGSQPAAEAAVMFLVAHALYKGALFLVVGILDHETGTRQSGRLGGLFRAMPATGLAGILAGFSMAGFMPSFNFIAKEQTYAAILETTPAVFWTAAFFVAGTCYVVVGGITGFQPFTGRPRERFLKPPHEAPPGMWVCPLIMAAAGVLVGVFPSPAGKYMLSSAVGAVLQAPSEVQPALWHGPDVKLFLSTAAILAGICLYLARAKFRRSMEPLNPVLSKGPEHLYSLSLAWLDTIACAQTRVLQSGRLNLYLLITIVTTTGLVGASMLEHEPILGLERWSDLHIYEAILAVVLLTSTVVIVRSRSRLAAVAALGVVGYAVALLFLLFSAPDLAMTQFCIETLSVVLLVMVLYRLPRYRDYSSGKERFRDAVVATLAGGLITALVLVATAVTREARLTPFFTEHSLLLAKGRNIVNVILVDFRGLDTLGEITVLAVAALGVYSLLKLNTGKKSGD